MNEKRAETFLFENWPMFQRCIDQIMGRKTLLENEHIKFMHDCHKASLSSCCKQAHDKRKNCRDYYFNLLPTLTADDDFIIKLKKVTGYDNISFSSEENDNIYHF